MLLPVTRQMKKGTDSKTLIICLLILLFSSPALCAERVWVFDLPQIVNYDSTRLSVIVKLLKQDIEFRSDLKIIQSNTFIGNDIKKRRLILQSEKATCGVSGKIIKIDNSITVYISKWDRRGKMFFEEQVSFPVNTNVGIMVSGIAECLIYGKKLEDTKTIDNLASIDKKTMALLDFKSDYFEESEKKIITDKLRAELIKTGSFTLVEREDMVTVLREQGFQQIACSSSECAIEAGQVLGAELIAIGRIDKLKNLLLMSLRVIDVKTGKIINAAGAEAEGAVSEVLEHCMEELVNEINNQKKLLAQSVYSVVQYKSTINPYDNGRWQRITSLGLFGGSMVFLFLAIQSYQEYDNYTSSIFNLSSRQSYKTRGNVFLTGSILLFSTSFTFGTVGLVYNKRRRLWEREHETATASIGMQYSIRF